MEKEGKRRKRSKNKKETEQTDEGDLFNQQIKLNDEKTLSQQEDLLLSRLKELNDRKRKMIESEQNVSEKRINKGKENSQCAKYNDSFICNIDTRTEFSPTVMVRVECNGIDLGEDRAFIDTGAHPNLISAEMAKQVKSHFFSNLRKLIGVDGKPFPIRHKLILKIRPWYEVHGDNYLKEIFWVLPIESEWKPVMPTKILNPTIGQNSTGIPFADPEFWLPKRAHLVLGVHFFAKMINSVIQRSINGIALMDTLFGIIVFGAQWDKIDENTGQVMSVIQYNESQQLDRLLERLWQEDQVKTLSPFTEEEIQAE